jgi:hypothetical protein
MWIRERFSTEFSSVPLIHGLDLKSYCIERHHVSISLLKHGLISLMTSMDEPRSLAPGVGLEPLNRPCGFSQEARGSNYPDPGA